MSKKIIYDSNVVIDFVNLPDTKLLHLHNNMLTLSAIPKNFLFINDPNPPITTVAEEEGETTSLVV